MMKIDRLRVRRLRLPLRVPYKLAFGPVTQFDTLLVEATLGGREGLGEATILTGYTDETIEGAWASARQLAAVLAGLADEEATARLEATWQRAPFTATAFLTALEMARGSPFLAVERETRVPLLAGLEATDEAGIAAEIERAIGRGFGTLKVKVGFAVAEDLVRVALVQRLNGGRLRLRVDANQGYDRDDGLRFATSVAPDDIELLEQPCDAGDWEASEAIARVSNVPLMLDESIYDERDIERAAAIGARFVKLKLMKLGTLARLDRALGLIRDLGMEPVLGNGVAGDVGCWMEGAIARRRITNAGELNGFLRQAKPLAEPPIRFEAGAMVLEPRGLPRLDGGQLARVTLAMLEAQAGKAPVERAEGGMA
jgi:L-alanine-DL-glutamate epimerase-like enolase superfamily enzyme